MGKFHQAAGVVIFLLTTVTARIQLVNHGYEKVVVTISPDIAVNPLLLTTLEDILTQGSAALFRATKNQVYFKEFIIVLPEQWPTQAHYENDVNTQLDTANIIIDQPNARVGDNPYVSNPNGCGNEGEFMHLTPNYILDDTIRGWFGPPGRLIVHEWAHLRWGVMDEYAYTSEEAFYLYFGRWYPTRCTDQVEGNIVNGDTGLPCELDSDSGRPAGNCVFIADLSSPAVASLMFMQHINNVVEFCDNPETAPTQLKHNKLAPNRQNIFCNYRSVWEVMRQHSDFSTLSSLPGLPGTTDTTPNFRYVQSLVQSSQRRVLLLDTSGSMSGQPLIQLRQAASSFILGSVEIGSQLGIVEFDSSAIILSSLMQIDSDDDRVASVNFLPQFANGGTNIGAGLEKGIEVLEENGATASGGSLILITDGQDSSSLESVIQTLITKGVTVHSIAIGQQADTRLADLSSRTGGRAFFFSGSQNSTAFIDGLSATVATDASLISNRNVSISILTEVGTATTDTPLSGTFYIDSTIGRDTTLIVTSNNPVEVEIESPLGPFNPSNTTVLSGSDSNILKIVLGDNNITTGLWSYRVNSMVSFVSNVITVNVQSKPQDNGQEIIHIRSWMSSATNETVSFSDTATLGLFAEVTRGKTPVVNASVIATVETPMGTTLALDLFDKGIGVDMLKEDGIYSSSINANDFAGDGRYGIKVKVVGTSGQTKVFVAGQGSANRAFDPRTRGFRNTESPTEPLEAFQRVTTAGEFRLIGYFPLTRDGLPPARITDFRLVKMSAATPGIATLGWTAVGGDIERGRAAQYRIYTSHDSEVIIGNIIAADLVSHNQVIQGNLNSPLAAGDREEIILYIRDLCSHSDDTIYMSIVAVDEANNQGEPSNLVTISDAKAIWVSGQDDENGSNRRYGSIVFLIAIFIIVSIIIWS